LSFLKSIWLARQNTANLSWTC